jgi:diguanylate cyclase (GGDEF)-like protein
LGASCSPSSFTSAVDRRLPSPAPSAITALDAGPVLDRVVDISAIRDADLLDLTLLHTLQELAEFDTLTLLRVAAGGEVLQETCLRAGKLTTRDTSVIDPQVAALLAQDIAGSAPLSARRDDGRSLSLYPLLDVRGVRTWLYVAERSAPSAAEQAMILGFARFFQNYRGLLDDAQRDALTGLRNRKTFDEMVLRLFATPTAQDSEQVVPGAWLGIVDIDHFKRINDTFGHLYGDEVLLLVAQRMQRNFRGEDLLFRFGGEEFVIIVRDASRAQAMEIFERFRTAIAGEAFPQVGTVTISIGMVELQPGRLTSLALDEADKALYWSKQHGRNRVALYEDLVAQGEMAAVVPQTGSIDLF